MFIEFDFKYTEKIIKLKDLYNYYSLFCIAYFIVAIIPVGILGFIFRNISLSLLGSYLYIGFLLLVSIIPVNKLVKKLIRKEKWRLENLQEKIAIRQKEISEERIGLKEIRFENHNDKATYDYLFKIDYKLENENDELTDANREIAIYINRL